jgi:hypothetical protein
MVLHGQVRNGVIVLENSSALPEGATVRVEVIAGKDSATADATPRRQGGVWKGQVVIARDFDELPDDVAESFGISKP